MTAAEALAALGIGLAGAGHCVGMCGGIAAALGLGGRSGPLIIICYHVGRLGSYTLLGALLSGIAGSIDLASWTLTLRYLAALLLIAMGLSIGGWWQGIRVLERGGALLWRPLQRLGSNLLPPRHAGSALLLGLLWGMLPCGLIYSALAWAATAEDPTTGALRMLLFGAGTLPAMLTASLGGRGLRELLTRPALKRVIAVLLIAVGIWNLSTAFRHGGHLTRPYGAGPAAPHHTPEQMHH